MFTALYGQLSSIKKTMDEIARTRENVSEKGKNGFQFTKQEIKAMPEHIRKIFIANNYIVNYRITSNGYFEARVRRKGMYIEASGRDFETMRSRFLQRLSAFYERSPVQPIEQPPAPVPTAKTVLFGEYGKEWLKIKERTTKPSTYKEYERLSLTNLLPVFGERPIADITRQELQGYLFRFIDEGKHRTAEKLYQILCCIFDLACEDLHIPSPMKKIVLPYYEPKKGSALTKEEEKTLVEFCIGHQDNEASSALLVLLYFGLRRSELKTISVENEMLTCTTSKTKMGRSEVKRSIPFTPVFRRVLPFVDFEKAKNTNVNTIYTTFKRLFPNHHTHELRYNFITRAKEAGCNLEAVMLWAGHSFDKDVKSSAVDRGYTDYSQEYLVQEAQKIDYIL